MTMLQDESRSVTERGVGRPSEIAAEYRFCWSERRRRTAKEEMIKIGLSRAVRM